MGTTLSYDLAKRVGFLTVAAAFALLYVEAEHFACDLGFAGLSDDTLRPIMHFVVYGSLALLLSKALNNWYLLGWLISVVFATLEETRQLFILDRFASLTDWFINLAGITCFLVGAQLLGSIVRRSLTIRRSLRHG